MALRTKLNIGEGEKNGLDELDDVDAVYINELEKSGISNDLLSQFLEITKELENNKKKEQRFAMSE